MPHIGLVIIGSCLCQGVGSIHMSYLGAVGDIFAKKKQVQVGFLIDEVDVHTTWHHCLAEH